MSRRAVSAVGVGVAVAVAGAGVAGRGVDLAGVVARGVLVASGAGSSSLVQPKATRPASNASSVSTPRQRARRRRLGVLWVGVVMRPPGSCRR